MQRKISPGGRHSQLLVLYGIPLLPSSPAVARRGYAAAYISNASSTGSPEAERARRRTHRYQLTFGPQARVSRNSNSSGRPTANDQTRFPGSTSTVCCRSTPLLLLQKRATAFWTHLNLARWFMSRLCKRAVQLYPALALTASAD